LLYKHMKTLEKTVRVILEQFIPSIQADIHYDKIAQSLDLSNGKKNLDYLSREELRHLTNTVFNRSKKLLSVFDMPLMTVINRLLASQTCYFVPNNDPGTN
ncbi:unnamed protein product, partial [Didymodactylos carnosus]